MFSEFTTYFQLGLTHIADLRGYDHILFIVALTAGFAARDWRKLLWLVTAFTLGHSLTLALATMDVVQVNTSLIELLIAITIVLTGAHGLWVHRRLTEPPRRVRSLYAMAGGFGLIHGLGFSGFLRSVLGGEETILWPLFSFNVGLELGQLCIVAAIVAVGALVCDVAGLARSRWAMAVSLITVLLGVRMLVERAA